MMNHQRSILSVSLVILFALPLLMPLPVIAAGDETAPASKNPGYITVTDSTGRIVKVPEQVKRIACLYLFSGHVVTMLGRGEDIVAVSNGLKRVSLLLEICPSIESAMVPKAQGALNMEELLKADPDVLFIPGDMSGNREELEKLNRLGIPTIIIDFSDMESQQQAIAIIGKAIGAPEKADRFNRFYRDCIDRVKAVTNQIPRQQRLKLYHSVNEANRTTLDTGLTTDWLKATGIINVALTSSMNILEGKNFVSIEQILLWNPDVILANEPEAFSLITNDSKWALIDAVRNKRIYQMPIAISRWGHPGSIETPMALLWTVKQLYPDLFKDINMEQETKAFYKTFFNHNLSEETVTTILSGKLLRKPKHESEKASGKKETSLEIQSENSYSD